MARENLQFAAMIALLSVQLAVIFPVFLNNMMLRPFKEGKLPPPFEFNKRAGAMTMYIAMLFLTQTGPHLAARQLLQRWPTALYPTLVVIFVLTMVVFSSTCPDEENVEDGSKTCNSAFQAVRKVLHSNRAWLFVCIGVLCAGIGAQGWATVRAVRAMLQKKAGFGEHALVVNSAAGALFMVAGLLQA